MKRALISWCGTVLLVATLLASACPAAVAAGGERVRADAPCGPMAGLSENGVAAFKGIPYAKPPVGDLRFAPPADAERWTETRDCSEYGPIAVQGTVFANGMPMSEDCLSLNVWTPAAGTDARLPVFVNIHGGGYAMGSGASPGFDGTRFASAGIVYVSINYRLNVLGFFASGETLGRYGTTGNWGHLDQVKALEWVRDNIAAFGGDPGNVTIGGESAGAYSVSAMILSPLAAGLFHGAILESGTVLSAYVNNYYARGGLRPSIAVSGMLAKGVFGAADDAAGLAAMRAADPAVLAELSPLIADFTVTPAFFMMPVFDGSVLPRDPFRALAEGRFNKVRMLWGYNADEGSVFVPATTDEAKYRMLVTRLLGSEYAEETLARFPVNAGNPPAKRAREVFALAMFAAPMKTLADAMAESGQDVYGYRFAYVSGAAGKAGLGAHHAAELPYVFDDFADWGWGQLEPTPAEKELARDMHARWVNFIKGLPPAGERPDAAVWPKYDPEAATLLRFDSVVRPESMPNRSDMDYVAGIVAAGLAGGE